MWYLQKCKSKPFISRSEHKNVRGLADYLNTKDGNMANPQQTVSHRQKN